MRRASYFRSVAQPLSDPMPLLVPALRSPVRRGEGRVPRAEPAPEASPRPSEPARAAAPEPRRPEPAAPPPTDPESAFPETAAGVPLDPADEPGAFSLAGALERHAGAGDRAGPPSSGRDAGPIRDLRDGSPRRHSAPAEREPAPIGVPSSPAADTWPSIPDASAGEPSPSLYHPEIARSSPSGARSTSPAAPPEPVRPASPASPFGVDRDAPGPALPPNRRAPEGNEVRIGAIEVRVVERPRPAPPAAPAPSMAPSPSPNAPTGRLARDLFSGVGLRQS